MTLTELNLWRTTLQFLAVRCTSTCARQFAIVSALLGLSLAAQATEPNLPMAMPGWNLVAIDTPTQTYIDYVNVPRSGKWEFAWPMLAKWESQKTYTAIHRKGAADSDRSADICISTGYKKSEADHQHQNLRGYHNPRRDGRYSECSRRGWRRGSRKFAG